MLAILVHKDTDRQRATLTGQDVLITPDLGTATATDFTAVNGAITRGEQAARGASAQLAALGVGAGAYRDYLARRAQREPGLPPMRFVRVDPESKRYEKTIMAEMQPLIGKPLDVDQVGKRITELYGLGNFETLDYTLVERPADQGRTAGAPGVAAGQSAARAGGERRRGRAPPRGRVQLRTRARPPVPVTPARAAMRTPASRSMRGASPGGRTTCVSA